jgi:glycosyltransferase involved in cell wall biosynthesis
MPVHNGESYLREAVESILCQTFRDFELLIINDGSSDGSLEILGDYDDARIRVVDNGKNLGISASLNRGIELARGDYIARMDCDDVSLPERLERQAAYLDGNPGCTVVGVRVCFMDAAGEPRGFWNDDLATPSSREIRRFLPRANCIAHPGVMVRKSALTRYGYAKAQEGSEDYDLWLRMCADGLVIDKLDEILLRYRLNPVSVTAVSKRKRPDLKNVRTKSCFLWQRLRHGTMNGFDLAVFLNLFRDLFFFAAKEAAALGYRILSGTGKLLGGLLPLHNPSGVFLFFPFYHIGGAERVHAAVASCLADRRPWVFFAKRSRDDALRKEFARSCRMFTAWFLLKYTYPLSAGILAGVISRQEHATVFGCNSLFFYKLLPLLSPRVRAIDLLHAFGGGAEDFSLPVAHLLQRRVVISESTRQELACQYRAAGLDGALLDRVLLIENRVEVPASCPEKKGSGPLRVLYVGRDSEEKRVRLVARVAALCRERGIAASFRLVGVSPGSIPANHKDSCECLGEVRDRARLEGIYQESDVLLLTSSREGFPLVIMEAMARGVVPVVTDVGGISRHLTDGVNGVLVPNREEDEIVREMAEAIVGFAADRDALRSLSAAAYEYARARFGGEGFCAAYRSLLLGEEQQERRGTCPG